MNISDLLKTQLINEAKKSADKAGFELKAEVKNEKNNSNHNDNCITKSYCNGRLQLLE